MNELRIVFMGTPEFAVASLGALLMNGYNVAGVVTAPDRPAGRGKLITKSAVKKFAEFSKLPILQPDNLKDPGFLKDLNDLNADIFVVVAFRLLPEVVWKMPPKGTINLHASLLPHYRGAAPINHVLINGEDVTGITTFIIDDKIDTGLILLRQEVKILPFENAGDLHNRLMKLGARLLINTLKGISENTLTPQPQSLFLKPGETLKTAPKIFPGLCFINWHNEALKINNLIRGLAPDPCARFQMRKTDKIITFKVFESTYETSTHSLEPGSVFSDGKNILKIACKDGFLHILKLQAEGKKRMSTQEFLRGFKINEWTVEVIQEA
ncbi:MAG TPA: methionyl-tRNA formyltransferase [Bacteroidales bacterium]|jgi:methionyl-tRNA formyltransferase|nr:methionyl-tRNA formyltransferase [Bacteroidales bacterium]HQB36300.1 methionyl-tRNA formyltransferase [Bacteroidales bacterium]